MVQPVADVDGTLTYTQLLQRICQVTPGSPADLAGVHPGDVVIEFHGKLVGSITEIIELLGDEIGIPLKVVVKRANDTVETLTVVPEEANPEIMEVMGDKVGKPLKAVVKSDVNISVTDCNS